MPGRVISGAGRKEREREGDDQCRLVLSFTWPHNEEAAAFRTQKDIYRYNMNVDIEKCI